MLMAKAPDRDDKLENAKRLMGALVRMKPKPHEEIKVGKKAKATTRQRSKIKKLEHDDQTES
jgi:hypothetical protein